MAGVDNTDDPPNVIVIHPHNLGQHLGCYGWSVDTPNIDSLAGEGIRLENYFCTASHCSPARGSMWTGNYPHNNGLIGLAHLGWSLNDDETTLIEYLNDRGYATHLFGIQHIADHPEEVGYQHVDGSTHEFTVDEPAATVAERVERFLTEDADRETPFFASVGFSEVHREPLVDRCLDCGWTFDLEGYDVKEPDSVEPLPYLPDAEGVRTDVAGLQAMVRAIDDAVGRITDALADSGQEDDTLIIFTTDHGIGFPRSMGTCYDPGVETACILRWPGHFDGGVVHDELLSNIDFTPTILDLVGAEIPEDLDGRSFLSLLAEEAYTPRDHVFLEFTWHSKYNPIRAIRTEDYKYVLNIGDVPRVYIPAPMFSSPSGKEVRNLFYGEQRPKEELYDLTEDPHEQANVIDGDDHQAVASDLRATVRSWMEDTNDRLLEGEWPPTPEQEERVKKSPWVPREIDQFC